MIEDLSEKRIVATGSLIVELKFTHNIGKVIVVHINSLIKQSVVILA